MRLGLVLAGVAYPLSVGPIDYLVERDVLPLDVLRYQAPLYSAADRVPALGQLLDWYVEKVWHVNQPALRDAPPALTPDQLLQLLLTNLSVTNIAAASTACVVESARTIGAFQGNSAVVVPALTKCLATSPILEARVESIRSLVRFGSDARLALPALTNALNDPEPEVRSAASNAVAAISAAVGGERPGSRPPPRFPSGSSLGP